MMAVFGPRVVNEKKFSEWSTGLEVLHLLFDTTRRTVSMPDSKIDKAVGRVEQMLGAQRTTKTHRSSSAACDISALAVGLCGPSSNVCKVCVTPRQPEVWWPSRRT